mmetsp:Transcript_28911/g.37991  ORF Transcript_28911/g.37991 Transcript_28911/m.37991 type:complete len:478 (+) Transcript_28911:205-1638(+)
MDLTSSSCMIFSQTLSSQLDGQKLYVRNVAASEVAQAYSIEAASYPEDEAATFEKLKFRQESAGDYFVGLYTSEGDNLLGFVCGTCCHGDSLEEGTMSVHIADGPSLCIHSVVISEEFRRKGHATLLLKAYVEFISHKLQNIKTILLISKAHLLRFYVRCGFSLVGLSDIVHGKDPWFEMKLHTTSQRSLPFLQVSAFANRPFSGNPAAVFFTHRTPEWMQTVAAELKLSETAFVSQIQDGSWHLRWFTPTSEVDLCGHATLASAHALWETGRVALNEEIQFSTLSGLLRAKPLADGWIELDFPEEPPHESPVPGSLEKGLGINKSDILFCGQSRVDYLVEVSPEVFDNLTVNIDELAKIETRGIIVTCKGGRKSLGSSSEEVSTAKRQKLEGDQFDFESRFFGPKVGVDEDPVTGSAHCCLGPYWSNKLGSLKLKGYQRSGRGGVVQVEIGTQDDKGRVKLQGQAMTCFTGSFKFC